VCLPYNGPFCGELLSYLWDTIRILQRDCQTPPDARLLGAFLDVVGCVRGYNYDDDQVGSFNLQTVIWKYTSNASGELRMVRESREHTRWLKRSQVLQPIDLASCYPTVFISPSTSSM